MSAHELLPCPFCGGKAHLSAIGRSWYRVTADHDECCILEEHESDCPQTDEQLQLLLRDWNARAGYTAVDMANAAADGFRDGAASKENIIDALLNHCEDGECHVCSQIICPRGDGMHFHHDGCPSCAQEPT